MSDTCVKQDGHSHVHDRSQIGQPATDPHGHLIPERSGTLPVREEVLLSNWACGVPAVISGVPVRISDSGVPPSPIRIGS